MKRVLAVMTLLTLLFAIVSCGGGQATPGTLDALSDLITNARASGVVTTIVYSDPEIGESLEAQTRVRVDYTSGKDPLVEFTYSYDRLGELGTEAFIVTETGTVYGALDNVGAEFDGMYQFVKDNSGITLAKPVVAEKKSYTESPKVEKLDGGYRISGKIKDSALQTVFGTDFGGASDVAVVWEFNDTHLVSMKLDYRLNNVTVTVNTAFSYDLEVVTVAE